jgi:hypothetical protein
MLIQCPYQRPRSLRLRVLGCRIGLSRPNLPHRRAGGTSSHRCALGRNRTCDTRFRKPLLFSTELRGRGPTRAGLDPKSREGRGRRRAGVRSRAAFEILKQAEGERPGRPARGSAGRERVPLGRGRVEPAGRSRVVSGEDRVAARDLAAASRRRPCERALARGGSAVVHVGAVRPVHPDAPSRGREATDDPSKRDGRGRSPLSVALCEPLGEHRGHQRTTRATRGTAPRQRPGASRTIERHSASLDRSRHARRRLATLRTHRSSILCAARRPSTRRVPTHTQDPEEGPCNEPYPSHALAW